MEQNKHVADLTSHSGALPGWEVCNDAHANPFLSQTLPALILPTLWTLLPPIQHLGVSEPIIVGVPTWGSTATSHPTADPQWDRKCCWNWRWASLRWRAGRIENTSGGMSKWMMNIKPWRPSSTYFLLFSYQTKSTSKHTQPRHHTLNLFTTSQQLYTHKNKEVAQRTKFTMGAVVSCVSSQHPQNLGRSS